MITSYVPMELVTEGEGRWQMPECVDTARGLGGSGRSEGPEVEGIDKAVGISTRKIES